LPLSLFAFKLAKLVHLYRVRVGANLRQTVAAAIAGLALAHTIGVAVVNGLFTRNEPFFRTPKRVGAHPFAGALAAARTETLLMLGLWLAAWAVTQLPQVHGPDRLAWVVALLVQSVPYASSLLASLVSVLPLPATWLGRGYREI